MPITHAKRTSVTPMFLSWNCTKYGKMQLFANILKKCLMGSRLYCTLKFRKFKVGVFEPHTHDFFKLQGKISIIKQCSDRTRFLFTFVSHKMITAYSKKIGQFF